MNTQSVLNSSYTVGSIIGREIITAIAVSGTGAIQGATVGAIVGIVSPVTIVGGAISGATIGGAIGMAQYFGNKLGDYMTYMAQPVVTDELPA